MESDPIAITTADFEYVRALAKNTAALVIDDDKRYLVETRLTTLAEQQGFESLRSLVGALRGADDSSRLRTATIDALTTNETLFFRDRHPFDALTEQLLPKLIDSRRQQKRLAIWSAAASTGQEAYSIAMLFRDKFPELLTWDLKIIGTDISDTVLAQAKSGIYGQHEINRGLPAPMLIKYFNQTEDRRWQIKPEVRSMVEFKPLNLIGSWLALPVFDIVFIRNVLIYFDVPTKRDILLRIANRMPKDGYLCLGSSETTVTITDVFKPVALGRATYYQKVSAAT